jgi:hypothetical protein
MALADDWRDNARDIAHFLLHYLPEDALSKTLPTHLPLLPGTISEHRKTKGFLSRSLVVVGHSFGGCSSCVVIASLNIFSSFNFSAGYLQPSVFLHCFPP